MHSPSPGLAAPFAAGLLASCSVQHPSCSECSGNLVQRHSVQQIRLWTKCKMADWLSKLEQLDIPDGAVAGLSNSDKPFLEGKLLQLSAGDRPLFFRGQQMDFLKRLRSLLPDTPAGTSDEVLLALVEIKSLLQVHSVLQLDRFMYTQGKVTHRNDPLVQLFSRDVKAEYGALQGSDCWCLLTNAVCHPLQSLVPTCSSGSGLNMFACLGLKTSTMLEMGCHCGSL